MSARLLSHTMESSPGAAVRLNPEPPHPDHRHCCYTAFAAARFMWRSPLPLPLAFASCDGRRPCRRPFPLCPPWVPALRPALFCGPLFAAAGVFIFTANLTCAAAAAPSCAGVECPASLFHFSAQPKPPVSRVTFGWLFITNTLLVINGELGQFALHQSPA
jgi:hypothetical protein